jgi:acyl-coenzyme A synthetase/AMP-(fatty) acid ligase
MRMKTQLTPVRSLHDSLKNRGGCASRFLWGRTTGVYLGDLLHGTILASRLSELAGRSVLLAIQDQLTAALAIVELDGIAHRLILCPPDVSPDHYPEIVEATDVDAIVSDQSPELTERLPVSLQVRAGSTLSPGQATIDRDRVTTDWVLLTSGTSGVPKMVVHNLASLTSPIKSTQHQETDVVWGTFYDIRRYGGLQIFLRAILGNGSLVLSSFRESPSDHLLRLAAHSVTHLSGTPSHWRCALMSPSARAITPRYIRLSGEIADQAILNTLHSFYPHAAIGHAFASTEAGVAFEVNDGLEGFPAGLVGASGEVEMKVEDGSLLIRSPRTASRLLGPQGVAVADTEGFVDTGDIVELRGDRYYFLGRRTGMINVGGLKVYPEEIEALLNRHPAVRMSCVRSRRNPITGSLVVADVVLKRSADLTESEKSELRHDILKICRDQLPRHKVPTVLNVVPVLNVASSGKVARYNA